MANTKVKSNIPDEIHKELAHYPELIRKLLYYRNITDGLSAEAFLNPVYSPHDPFLLKGMTEAVARLLKAIKNDERITIFSDYDADGVPGAVVLNDFFQKIGYKNFDVYIPNRHSEGFGLNNEAIKEIAGRGTKLIITVDCGIADAKEIDLSNSLGVDVVVTDHHTPVGHIPKAVAVVDPKQNGCQYPFKELCGAGVAFKLVEASLSALRLDPLLDKRFKLEAVPLGWEKWLLDMVAIATLSDMVPLVGENRMFAKFGMLVLKKTSRPGLGALFSALRLRRFDISEDDITFSIAPRINAASRMGDPLEAFNLLATKNEVEAIRLAKSLEALNNERKGVVASLTKEIKHLAKERNFAEKKVIVAGNPSWRPPLLGLVAGVIAEEFNKPVFLWGKDTETTYKGSCRGGGGIDVLELMGKTSGIFLEYGGHAGAGGFSVSFEEIHRLESDLEKAILECESSDTEGSSLIADAVLRLEELNWNLFSDLNKLAPFGESNPKPVFLIESAKIDEVRIFGKTGNHTALRFDNGVDEPIEAISFFTKPEDFKSTIGEGKEVSFFANIEKSNFRNRPEMRLRLIDIL